MKLNIYKNQRDIEKTVYAEKYDLMYGTVEDILAIFDSVSDVSDNMQLFDAVVKNREKLNELLKDVFPDLTNEDLKKIKVAELVPFFMELFDYVKSSFRSNLKN